MFVSARSSFPAKDQSLKAVTPAQHQNQRRNNKLYQISQEMSESERADIPEGLITTEVSL